MKLTLLNYNQSPQFLTTPRVRELEGLYGIRLIKVYQNPQAEAWGYTDKARLRGLIQEIDFYQPDLGLQDSGFVQAIIPV